MTSSHYHLLQKKDLLSVKDLPGWLRTEYRNWVKIVGSSKFPCHFGVAAEKAGHLRYTYLENHDFTHLPQTLSAFLQLSKTHPNNRHALVLFIQPDAQMFDYLYCYQYFWNILQYLHQHDEKKWPADIPTNPEDPFWEFVYNEEPMFISLNGPCYKQRITRNLGNSLILIFQPRRIFSDISYTSVKGKKTIQMIRSKVEAIENIPFHPDLGSYEDPQKREWKQYAITDDLTPTKGICPMKYFKK